MLFEGRFSRQLIAEYNLRLVKYHMKLTVQVYFSVDLPNRFCFAISKLLNQKIEILIHFGEL